MGIRYTCIQISPFQNGPKFISLHTPWFQFACTPAKESHTLVFQRNSTYRAIQKRAYPPAECFQQTINQLLCSTFSQTTLVQILPTTEEAVWELDPVVAFLRPKPWLAVRTGAIITHWDGTKQASDLALGHHLLQGYFFHLAENKALTAYRQLDTCQSSLWCWWICAATSLSIPPKWISNFKDVLCAGK